MKMEHARICLGIHEMELMGQMEFIEPGILKTLELVKQGVVWEFMQGENIRIFQAEELGVVLGVSQLFFWQWKMQ